MSGGLTGPLPKPAGERIRRNKPKVYSVPPSLVLAGALPEPKDEWCPSVKDEWREFWNSPIASMLNINSDLSALRRLFDYKHEYVWALNAYRKERITLGSMGQQRVNPMADVMVRLEKMIVNLEDRFGMSPVGRVRLGAQVVETAKNLNDMNAAIDAEVAGDEDHDEDPRAIFGTLPGNTGTTGM